MSLRRKSWRPYIGHPDLNRAQALLPQSLPMFSGPPADFASSHTPMFHVTAGNGTAD